MSPEKPEKVKFFFDNTAAPLQSRRPLKKFIESVFKKEGRKLLSLNYVFCTDRQLLAINRQYLRHSYLTDIITFDLTESSQPLVAEVYISVNRVKENAIRHGATFKEELHRVILHGALHLCGYRDKTANERKEMTSKEDFYLVKYFG